MKLVHGTLTFDQLKHRALEKALAAVGIKRALG
jgi:hypothetical protein